MTPEEKHERDVQAAAAACRQNPKLELLEGGTSFPKPKPIPGLPAVQKLDPKIIPAAYREYCRDVAERMQVPLDCPFGATIVCGAGAIGRRARMQPMERDTSWIVVPNLWGVNVAEAGAKKSPVLYAVAEPLRRIEARWRADNEVSQQEYLAAKEKFEVDLGSWKKQGCKGDRPTTPEVPKKKRLIINDSSFEAVHRAMCDNPAGLIMLRDEISGWLGALDRKEHGGDREFYLSTWGGDTPYDMDRIGRGDLPVPHSCLSILGTITPLRLKGYLVNREGNQASQNDGLLQRFQVLTWPDETGEFQYVDKPPQQTLIDAVARIFTRVVEMDCANPTLFRFGPKAQKRFKEWLTDLENKKIRDPNLNPELRSHLAKYRSLMPSLALQFEVADRVLENNPKKPVSATRDGTPRWVSVEHTEQAIKVCNYFESHARRAYFCIQTPAMAAAWELSQKIRQKKLRSPFSYANIYQKHWSGLNTENTKKAVEILVELDWVSDRKCRRRAASASKLTRERTRSPGRVPG